VRAANGPGFVRSARSRIAGASSGVRMRKPAVFAVNSASGGSTICVIGFL
jgi:hypothetical protein